MSDLQNKTQSRAPGRVRSRTLAVAATVLAAAVIWLIGDPLLGNDLVVKQPGQEPLDLGLGAVVTISLGASLAGWATLALLEKLTQAARRIWTALAIAVLALSFLPFLQADMSTGSAAVLALLHLAVAAVLIPLLLRTPQTPAQP